MKRAWQLVCSATVLLASSLFWPQSGLGQAIPSDDQIRTIIRERVDAGRAHGIVIGIREADGTHRIVSYGDPGPGALPLGPESVFEIGSITKVFTGILLAEMSGRGEVSLEDPVQKFLPPGVTVPPQNGATIRLLDLSTHRSGLPRLPFNLAPVDANNPYADYSVDLLYGFLSSYSLPRDIGAEFEYSNLGTGLLGHVLGLAVGKDYEGLVRDRILDPLGMERTAISLSRDMEEHLVPGHNERGDPVANWDFPTLAGAGALRSNAEDMLAFLDANIEASGTGLGEAMRLSHSPRQPSGGGMSVGLNWMTRTSGERKIVWHNGGTGGYRTFVGFDPARAVGVVVLNNSSQSADDIGFHLLDPSLPLAQPQPESLDRTEIEVGREILESYVGVYELNPNFSVSVTLAEGGLSIQATGQPRIPIFAETETHFFLKVVDAQITFVRSQTGEATELILHQGGRDQRARKVR